MLEIDSRGDRESKRIKKYSSTMLNGLELGRVD